MCNWRIVLFMILLSSLSVNETYSCYEKSDTTISVSGYWRTTQTRSLSPIPISAHTDGKNIYIENSSPDCDILITIISHQTGEVILEQSVPEVQTEYIIISIADFPSGGYKLELTDGTTDNYLTGDFEK